MVSAEDFIRAHTTVTSPPLCPELRLCLGGAITPIWQDMEAWLGRQNLAPPYWAFCWPGGVALARHVLDQVDVVRGRRVLDLAAGCGIAAIAAAKAGAASVQASEIDSIAATALRLNAALNGVAVEVLLSDVTAAESDGWDVILAGDVCYERPMAARVFPWLQRRARHGARVLLGDPGRDYLPKRGLREVVHMLVPTSLDLEKDSARETVVYEVLR